MLSPHNEGLGEQETQVTVVCPNCSKGIVGRTKCDETQIIKYYQFAPSLNTDGGWGGGWGVWPQKTLSNNSKAPAADKGWFHFCCDIWHSSIVMLSRPIWPGIPQKTANLACFGLYEISIRQWKTKSGYAEWQKVKLKQFMVARGMFTRWTACCE